MYMVHHKKYAHGHTLDSKVHGANMGAIWGRQDPSGPHVGPMSFAIWDIVVHYGSLVSINFTFAFQNDFISTGKIT